jgi:hypothetical protein
VTHEPEPPLVRAVYSHTLTPTHHDPRSAAKWDPHTSSRLTHLAARATLLP